jgi:hypothetical protein
MGGQTLWCSVVVEEEDGDFQPTSMERYNTSRLGGGAGVR